MQTQRNAPGKDRFKSIGFGLVFGLAGLSVGYFGGKYLKSSALLQAIGPESAKKVSDLPFHGQRRFEEKWLGALMEKIGESAH